MVATVTMPPARLSLSEPSDEALLLKYRDSGDTDAFEMLVHRYEKPLFNYLLRYLHNATFAEDVFQATFLRLHEKCRLFTEDRRFRPWLYSIATHLAVDALRAEGRHPAVSLDREQVAAEDDISSLLNTLRSHVPSPLENLETDERAKWIRREVDALPEQLRVILLLGYFQGLKFQEVAEILQLPLGTVKSRLHKALVTLHAAWRRNHAEVSSRQT
jgi:RNA polymerase sigma-70 factor (ECF subfamily)